MCGLFHMSDFSLFDAAKVFDTISGYFNGKKSSWYILNYFKTATFAAID